jgi:predicted kinase|tara:strand:- start:104 stop:505 length:402 start_codon:yes stop_codon:yes gene_type:complete
MTMNKTLYLIRGLPGSGKSTLANKLAPEASFEADQYFTNNNGEYNYDQSKIDSAHHVCQKWTECAMVIGHEDIAVANTFTQMWEMTVYFELAEKHGYTVNVIECKNNFGSTHDVPEYAIDRMAERWETFDRIF